MELDDRERDPARHLGQAIGKRLGVAVREEQAAHSRPHRLGETARGARHDRDAADDRLERGQPEGLRPGRGRNQRPCRPPAPARPRWARTRPTNATADSSPSEADSASNRGRSGPSPTIRTLGTRPRSRSKASACSRVSTPFSGLSRPVKTKRGSAEGARVKPLLGGSTGQASHPASTPARASSERMKRLQVTTASALSIPAPDQRVPGLLAQPSRWGETTIAQAGHTGRHLADRSVRKQLVPGRTDGLVVGQVEHGPDPAQRSEDRRGEQELEHAHVDGIGTEVGERAPDIERSTGVRDLEERLRGAALGPERPVVGVDGRASAAREQGDLIPCRPEPGRDEPEVGFDSALLGGPVSDEQDAHQPAAAASASSTTVRLARPSSRVGSSTSSPRTRATKARRARA